MKCEGCKFSVPDDSNRVLICRRYPATVQVTKDWWCGEYKSETATKRSAPFKPPTLEEVEAYCLERRNEINPQQFMDHNTARGWRLKQGPMKCWKSAIRTWEARWKESQKEKAAPTAGAGSHTSFKNQERPQQTAEDKRRAMEDLQRMQRLIEERKKSPSREDG